MKNKNIGRMNWKILFFSFVIVFGVALIGSWFTNGNTDGEWYQSIKPSITPPNYVFPIVWNILFVMISISLYLVWIKSNNKNKKKVAWVFGVNLFLNALWSFLFFYLKNPVASFFEIIALWLSILLMIKASWKIDRRASYLLVPYLIWVSFASYLNWLIAFG